MTGKRILILLSAIAIIIIIFVPSYGLLTRFAGDRDSRWQERMRQGMKARRPSDWFFAQRAYPYGEVNLSVYKEEMEKVLEARRERRIGGTGYSWAQAGPTNIGGRISGLAVDPRDRDVIYAGAASGGVLKSVDGGLTWDPLFDDLPTLSIGALAIDPVDPEILYVGTGEANGGGGSVTYGGFGVYKTTDGGLSWNNVGLEETRYIGKVVVDPIQPERVYVGAAGTLFSKNDDRGVYRTTNGGIDWEQVLFISDSTGAIDIVQDLLDTDVLYAAMWERIRRPDSRRYGGVTSGVYKTTDGGDNWVLLTNGIPSNSSNVGRIGLALSAANPSTVYAMFADAVGYFMGVYRSTDSGDSWARVNDGALQSGYFYSSYGWWFGVIVADPADEDIVYAHGITMYKTTDGGDSWYQVGSETHVDNHAMVIDPGDHDWVVEGDDGGVFISTDQGASWTKSYDLPITQFYTGEIDYQSQDRLYGGTQDNGTIRTWTGGTDAWQEIYGGDGFYVLVDPTDSYTIYANYQYGGLGKSTDGGYSFGYALNGVNEADRRNWSTPVVMDPSDPNTLYYGTYRLYRTTSGASYWTAVSGDLTDGPGSGNLVYNTITTIAVAPTDPQVIYVGTDDGNVWVTPNGGGTWYDIGAVLPERWVTRVAVDPYDALKAYVTLSGFRWDSPLPHVFATTNGGADWTDISGDLPEIPVNDIIVDPAAVDHLYIGTDVGVYRTTDGGTTWEGLHEGFPIIPVTDLTFHPPTRTLCAATYGRSMFTTILSPPTRVEGDLEPSGHKEISLGQNFPNPFNPSTDIRFSLPEDRIVDLTIYDHRGRVVRTLVQGKLAGGDHAIIWDGRDDQGAPLPSGPYIYRLDVQDRVITRKMLLTR